MLSHFLRKWWPFGARREAATADRTADGLRWHVLPDASAFFDVPALTEWVRSGLAVVVKQNLQRTVYRIPLPAGMVFVKVCRANTPRAWVREILRPPKARLEFENAVRLLALGVGCTTPLAWGEADSLWPGDSVIVTREQADTEPLDTFLTDKLPTRENAVRRQLARELGRFVAKLHDAGVCHPDPHPGNFLVEVPASRVPHFFLLDVHSVRFGPPLDWPDSRANLVLLNRWFQMRGTVADRARFWQAYHLTRAGLCTADREQLAAEVEAATLASNLRFWAVRTGRYLGNNRQFREAKRGGVRGHVVRDLPKGVWQAWFANPDGVFETPDVTLLKDSRSSTVAISFIPLFPGGEGLGVRGTLGRHSPSPLAPLPQGRGGPEQKVLFKRFRLKKRFASLRNLIRRSPALRSWVNGHALLDRGIPTARPLAVFHRRTFGIPREGYVVFEFVEGAVGLADAVTTFDKRQLAERLGRMLRLLHDREVSHRDLKAPNILVTPAGEPVLIDLVGVTTGTPVAESQRMRELARLAASFVGSVSVTNADRLRVLLTYLRANRGDWKTWWTGVAVAVGAKVRRNAKVGRPLG